ncbi:hypothetical protein EV182_003985 [Spiromyces aspiralis]|uniref:Uncharacterized protein n=1 Tax=Spiromyces aspiralis TaxID=68401 RepID=A0ACC1HPJ9_9FUNG|nr:hypothetical protein EV182_003985 [Spiromyces aspiralis]
MSRNGSSRDLLRIALSTNARAEPSAGVTGNGGTSRKAAGKGSRKNSRAPSRMHSREASSSDEDEWDDTSSLVSEVESWSLDIDSFDDENVVSSGPAMLHTTNSAQEQASKIMEALETLSEKRTS